MSRAQRQQRRQLLLGGLTAAVALGSTVVMTAGPRGQVNLLGTLLLAAVPLIDAARLAFHYHDSDEYGRSLLLRSAALALGVTLAALTLTALLGAASPGEQVAPSTVLGLAFLGWLTLVLTHAFLTWREGRATAG